MPYLVSDSKETSRFLFQPLLLYSSRILSLVNPADRLKLFTAGSSLFCTTISFDFKLMILLTLVTLCFSTGLLFDSVVLATKPSLFSVFLFLNLCDCIVFNNVILFVDFNGFATDFDACLFIFKLFVFSFLDLDVWVFILFSSSLQHKVFDELLPPKTKRKIYYLH